MSLAHTDGSTGVPAVASACAGVPEPEQTSRLLGGELAVADTRPVIVRLPKQIEHRTLGAEVYVWAEQGLTAHYLHHVARCQVARYEANLMSSTSDPLAVPGAEVDVRTADGGFVVRITAETRAAGRAIADRAAHLGASRPGARQSSLQL